MTLVIAHRGASRDEPENSLAAFRTAVAQDADGIELDIHGTTDGELVVVHDPVIDGTPIGALPASAVRRHRLENGEVIPTLTDSLKAIGLETDVFIEAKTLAATCDDALLAVIDAAPSPGRCQVHAFDHRIVHR